MITKWKVFNFKSVRKETELEFAPLTIFSGANSSGKSTFLQSILLVAQTLSHKVSSRSVVLNGALARLGQFDDLRSTDSEAGQIMIGWTCRPTFPTRATRAHSSTFRRGRAFYGGRAMSLSSVGCEITFDTEGFDSLKEVAQIQPLLFSSMLHVILRDAEGGDCRSSLSVRRAGITSIEKKIGEAGEFRGDENLARESFQQDVELDEGSLEELREDLVSAYPVGCSLRHFLPERVSVSVDLVAEDARAIYTVLIGDGRRAMPRLSHVDREELAVPARIVALVLTSAKRVGQDAFEMLVDRMKGHLNEDEGPCVPLRQFEHAIRRLPPHYRGEVHHILGKVENLQQLVFETLREEREAEQSIVSMRPPHAIAEGASYLDDFFSTSVRYLGPLRDEPKSLYPLAPTADPSDVGLRGEHTAAVLDLHKNHPIRYIPTSAFSEPEIRARPSTRSLDTAVIDWLKYLGVAKGVQSRDRGKFGHELKVSVGDTSCPYDLTHVGVGVSQVLPILVASLLAEPDTTLIFEQPELHLHPMVQTRLADFFLSMTVLGKQCIIETHSEYLISRIRLRTAAATTSNPWVASTKVYFAECDDGGSVFNPVKINEYGAILNWPEGFFDQSQRAAEQILRAAMAKKKAERNRGGENE